MHETLNLFSGENILKYGLLDFLPSMLCTKDFSDMEIGNFTSSF